MSRVRSVLPRDVAGPIAGNCSRCDDRADVHARLGIWRWRWHGACQLISGEGAGVGNLAVRLRLLSTDCIPRCPERVGLLIKRLGELADRPTPGATCLELGVT